MKNLSLAIMAVFIIGAANAQKMTPKFLKGEWENQFHTVKFSGDTKKQLLIDIVVTETGEPIEVIEYNFDNNNLFVETYYAPNDIRAIGRMLIIDNNTMVEDVSSAYPGILIYKRKQNQQND